MVGTHAGACFLSKRIPEAVGSWHPHSAPVVGTPPPHFAPVVGTLFSRRMRLGASMMDVFAAEGRVGGGGGDREGVLEG